ncbi:MAG: O-antigen ligase family protein [Thermoguttaceae bacterium]
MTRRKPDRKARPLAVEKSDAPAGEAGIDRWRPWLLVALAALFVARPLFPSEAAAAQGDGLPVVMLWLALAIFWLLGAIGRRKLAIRFGWTDGAVAVLVGLYSISALWGAWDSNPRPAVNMLWEWVGFGLSFFLARQLVTGRREVRALVVVMVAVAVSLAGHGLYQYFYELPTTRAMYEKDPDRALRAAGLWFEPGSREREMYEKRLESVEPLATFALTNSLAGYLAPWLVIAVGIGFGAGACRPEVGPTRPGSEERIGAASSGSDVADNNGAKTKLCRWLAVAIIATPIAICLLLTKSRSAYLAALFGMLLVGVVVPGRFRLNWRLFCTIAAIGAVLFGVAVAIGGLDRLVWSEASKSLGYRLEYWQATLHMIADHPLAGCGPGHFQHAYTAYKLPQASEEIADPHNFLLEVWATAGTPTLLALLAVLGVFYGSVVLASRRESNASTASPPAAEPDSPIHVLVGGALGFLLSVPLGLMSSAPPGMTPVAVGLPLAVGTAFLFLPWINRGVLPRSLLAIGVLVLLVNLLAAGGIGFPGVAGSLWLLLAVGLVGTRPPREWTQRSSLLALAAGVGLAVACYASAYSPVMKCQGAMRMADRDPGRAEAYLHEAAAADPLASEPWKQLANMTFSQWRQQPDPEAFQRFDQAAREALARESQAASAWLYYGDRYFDAFSTTDRSDDLKMAKKMYQRAVELYPNSAICRAKLATAYRAAGQGTEFRQEAERALQLDAITPHLDKKLPEDIRESLKRGGSPMK